jgi:hypothetical protein
MKKRRKTIARLKWVEPDGTVVWRGALTVPAKKAKRKKRRR